ncbi:hypothetical protein PAUR_a0838 [Pseudoalteromonas aurantia 208]|uniref:Uncharacterized protein n=1 Tax=Pseudoalteromonas aurantia 208 TaxID=1314867 RepID=A0ABR9E918_9GAMM|nr:hypothetical protein [Pseudoalteromonas aurantia 208]
MVITSPIATGVINKKTPINEGTIKANKVRKSIDFARLECVVIIICLQKQRKEPKLFSFSKIR